MAFWAFQNTFLSLENWRAYSLCCAWKCCTVIGAFTFLYKNGPIQASFLFIFVISTANSKKVQYQNFPITGFDPLTSGIGSNHSANWTTAHCILQLRWWNMLAPGRTVRRVLNNRFASGHTVTQLAEQQSLSMNNRCACLASSPVKLFTSNANRYRSWDIERERERERGCVCVRTHSMKSALSY